MKKMTTAACALALGIAWAAAPAMAQETTKEKAERKADQIEQKADQKANTIERKADQKADEIKAKADDKADKARDKAEGKSDTMGDKMDRAWDKTKAKTREVKNKVKDSVSGHGNGRASADVRSAQQALQDKGFNPGPIDGVKGPRTTAAVRDFQQKENLTVTGQLDAETNARLMAAAPPAASPASEPKETNPKRQSQ
jgi:Skp family chaperone for outer membrane proteins